MLSREMQHSFASQRFPKYCELNSQLEEGTAEGKADVNQGGGHGVWKSHSETSGRPRLSILLKLSGNITRVPKACPRKLVSDQGQLPSLLDEETEAKKARPMLGIDEYTLN